MFKDHDTDIVLAPYFDTRKKVAKEERRRRTTSGQFSFPLVDYAWLNSLKTCFRYSANDVVES